MTSTVILALAVFGASAVEMVEALTIVLAAGVTRGWRSALEGSAVAVLVLAVLVAGVGVPLVHLVPLNALRVVVGALLLVLGLNWLRKAILRASGHKAEHDEDAIYARTVASLSAGVAASPATGGRRGVAGVAASASGLPASAPIPPGAAKRDPSELGPGSGPMGGRRDAVGFTVAFKGVLLEGLEVVMIVLTLGSSSRHLGLAAAAAGAAVVLVTGAGVVVARQLSEVPENAMKMVVGVMLTSFGVFWVAEGAGIRWPGSDLFLLALVGLFSVTAAVGINLMRHALGRRRDRPTSADHPVPSQAAPAAERDLPKPVAYLRAFGRFWWEFLVGDTPELLLATLLVVGLAELLHHHLAIAIVSVLAAAVACLGLSTWLGRMKSVESE